MTVEMVKKLTWSNEITSRAVPSNAWCAHNKGFGLKHEDKERKKPFASSGQGSEGIRPAHIESHLGFYTGGLNV